MTDDRAPLDKLEDSMIELGSLYRALGHIAAAMASPGPLTSVLYSIANHLEHIHKTLYEHYEAVMEERPRGPRLVDKEDSA